MNRVRISIIVRVIAHVSSISRSPKNDRPLATTPRGSSILQRSLGQRPRLFYNSSRIIRSPTVGQNRNQAGQITHRFCFLRISHRSGNQTHTHQSCIGRGSRYTERVIPLRRCISRAGCAMVVSRAWIRIGIIAVPVLVVGCIHVHTHIWMSRLQSIIDDTYAHARTLNAT